MKTRRGHPRKLSDPQIRKVMKWHQDALEFRRRHGTLVDLAIVLGASLRAVRGCLENRIARTPHCAGIPAPQSPGRRGRPRHLNPAQIAFAIAWHEAGRRFYARHGSIAGLARRLGVSASTIHDCIRREGRYRQRAGADASKAPSCRRNQPPTRDNARRSALLRAWSRSQRKPLGALRSRRYDVT
jgi:transposase